MATSKFVNSKKVVAHRKAGSFRVRFHVAKFHAAIEYPHIAMKPIDILLSFRIDEREMLASDGLERGLVCACRLALTRYDDVGHRG